MSSQFCAKLELVVLLIRRCQEVGHTRKVSNVEANSGCLSVVIATSELWKCVCGSDWEKVVL